MKTNLNIDHSFSLLRRDANVVLMIVYVLIMAANWCVLSMSSTGVRMALLFPMLMSVVWYPLHSLGISAYLREESSMVKLLLIGALIALILGIMPVCLSLCLGLRMGLLNCYGIKGLLIGTSAHTTVLPILVATFIIYVYSLMTTFLIQHSTLYIQLKKELKKKQKRHE